MPRTIEANQLIRSEREAQIRTAAGKLFAHNGYVGTRIDDIAALTGISKGLIYHYYGSKESLFNQLLDRAARGTIALYEAALHQEGSALEKLQWLIGQILAGLQKQPDMFMVVMQAFLSETAPREAQFHAQQLTIKSTEIMTRIIIEGQQAGDIQSGDPSQLALVCSSCIQGLAVGCVMEAPITSMAHTLVNLLAAKP